MRQSLVFESEPFPWPLTPEWESEAYPGISCVTPGNPYVLHCFSPFTTELTKEHHDHLDIIVDKIRQSFSTSQPISKVTIVGHSSTWHEESRSNLERRARERASNAYKQLILRLQRVGLANRVEVAPPVGRSDTERWMGKPYSSTSGSPSAQNDRALNRRVEILLNRGIPEPLPKCATETGTKPKIDVSAAVRANQRLSESLRWGPQINDITQDVLFTYRYGIADSGLTLAVADWQRENCFRKIDGILDREVWDEMRHLLGIHPILSKVDVRKRRHLRYVNAFLPRGGLGYCATKPPSHRYGLPETISALETIGINWWLERPSAPRIQVRDISPPYGSTSKWLTHGSHRIGIDADIGLMRKDCLPYPVHMLNKHYSRPLTQQLVNAIVKNGVLKVARILCDDPGVTYDDIVKADGIHANHLHVRFCMPVKYDLARMRRESNTSKKAVYRACV